MDQPRRPAGRAHDIRPYRPSFAGMVLLVCALFLVLGAWPAYGALGTVLLTVVWLVLFVLGCRWFMARPMRVLVVGLLSVGVWLAAVLAVLAFR